jgi:hypothetical protein
MVVGYGRRHRWRLQLHDTGTAKNRAHDDRRRAGERGLKLSDDGYLLQKVVPQSKITREIDWKALGITIQMVHDFDRTKKAQMDVLREAIIRGSVPQDDQDRYHISKMCSPYAPPPDDRDVFVWYDDIGNLSGTAGYLRIRDGYVFSRAVVIMS